MDPPKLWSFNFVFALVYHIGVPKQSNGGHVGVLHLKFSTKPSFFVVFAGSRGLISLVFPPDHDQY